MNVKWILAILGCLLCLRQCVASLRMFQAIFRHGNRAPSVRTTTYYPKDPYINMTYAPIGEGNLSNRGKQVSYELGEFFRKRYSAFLGTTYSKNLVRFRADEVPRIIATGQLVAAGMFPSKSDEKWSPDLKLPSVPILAPPFETDYLYNGMYCSVYQKYRAEAEHNKNVHEALTKYHQELGYISKHAGTRMTPFKCFLLRQQLYAQADMGLKLPEWTKQVYPHGALETIAQKDMVIQSYTLDMKRLLAGVWLHEWMSNIDNYLKTNGRNQPKAYMYAAHEFNMAPILLSLHAYDYKIPSYGSAIILELHEDKPNEFYVKMFYKNKDEFHPVILPGIKGVECPLKHFRKLIQKYAPGDPSKHCGRVSKDALM